MTDDILKYLPGMDSLPEAEARAIAEQIIMKSYPKGSLLLKEGDVSAICYFVLKGCVRQYHLSDGDEKTTAFYTEQQAVVPFTSYVHQTPSSHSLVCAEDCLLVVGDLSREQDMYTRFPKLLEITRTMMEQDFGKTQEAFSRFISSSPEERYLHLLDTRPDLFMRVPQHQIASYLGMTAESLSRIRKRTTKK